MTNKYWQYIKDLTKHFQSKVQLLSPLLLSYLLPKGTLVFSNFIFNLNPNALHVHEFWDKWTFSSWNDLPSVMQNTRRKASSWAEMGGSVKCKANTLDLRKQEDQSPACSQRSPSSYNPRAVLRSAELPWVGSAPRLNYESPLAQGRPTKTAWPSLLAIITI